ncbi:Hypothetical protein Cul210932_0120 [Corynebacterium ulcerans]|nr:Hypothetical protein Cul210932_0120 [Corynebacterium ulcerans]ALD93862.1 Hypothetical protein Cul131001_0122 [Corynebacterium ulcerans]
MTANWGMDTPGYISQLRGLGEISASIFMALGDVFLHVM